MTIAEPNWQPLPDPPAQAQTGWCPHGRSVSPDGVCQECHIADLGARLEAAQRDLAECSHTLCYEIRHREEGDKPELVKLSFENGRWNALMRHPNVALFAQELVKFFRDAGAVNYVEITIATPELDEFILTLQRKLGKTPHELKMEAEKRLDEALAVVGRRVAKIHDARAALSRPVVKEVVK